MPNINLLIKKSFFVTLIFFSSLNINSCIVAAVSIGNQTTNYIDGVYTMKMEGDFQAIYKAAIESLNNKNTYHIINSTNRGNIAKIDGYTKIDGSVFYIKIVSKEKSKSLVTIKFGTFGDQAQSSTLMDRIQETLNKNIPNINYA